MSDPAASVRRLSGGEGWLESSLGRQYSCEDGGNREAEEAEQEASGKGQLKGVGR